MKQVIITIVILLVFGCSSRKAMLPDGRVLYESLRFGTKEQIKHVEFRSAQGDVFVMDGYAGDQVEALGVVTEAAVRGAVGAAVPGSGAFRIPAGFNLAPKDDPSTPKLEVDQ